MLVLFVYIKVWCFRNHPFDEKKPRNARRNTVSYVYQARLPLPVAPYLYANIIEWTNKKSYIPEDSELKWIYKKFIKVVVQML